MKIFIDILLSNLAELSALGIALLIRYLEKKLLKSKNAKEIFELQKTICELQNKKMEL
jgi:uncharacterized membrane protein